MPFYQSPLGTLFIKDGTDVVWFCPITATSQKPGRTRKTWTRHLSHPPALPLVPGTLTRSSSIFADGSTRLLPGASLQPSCERRHQASASCHAASPHVSRHCSLTALHRPSRSNSAGRAGDVPLCVSPHAGVAAALFSSALSRRFQQHLSRREAATLFSATIDGPVVCSLWVFEGVCW